MILIERSVINAIRSPHRVRLLAHGACNTIRLEKPHMRGSFQSALCIWGFYILQNRPENTVLAAFPGRLAYTGLAIKVEAVVLIAAVLVVVLVIVLMIVVLIVAAIVLIVVLVVAVVLVLPIVHAITSLRG